MTQIFLTLTHPLWLAETIDWDRPYRTDADTMALAIDLSRWMSPTVRANRLAL